MSTFTLWATKRMHAEGEWLPSALPEEIPLVAEGFCAEPVRGDDGVSPCRRALERRGDAGYCPACQVYWRVATADIVFTAEPKSQ